MQFFKKRTNKPTKEEINRLSEHYRSNVMNEETLKLLPQKEFSNLIDVSKYATIGRWTAIEAAFCLGYEAGKAGADNEQE